MAAIVDGRYNTEVKELTSFDFRKHQITKEISFDEEVNYFRLLAKIREGEALSKEELLTVILLEAEWNVHLQRISLEHKESCSEIVRRNSEILAEYYLQGNLPSLEQYCMIKTAELQNESSMFASFKDENNAVILQQNTLAINAWRDTQNNLQIQEPEFIEA